MLAPSQDSGRLWVLCYPAADFKHLSEESTKIGKGEWGIVLKCEFKQKNEYEKRMLKFYSAERDELFEVNKILPLAVSLRHEHVLGIYGQTLVGERGAIIFENMDGGNLKDVIHDKSIAYSIADILRWSTQLASALQYINLHTQKLFEHTEVNREVICPQNMWLNDDRTVLKICFFGFSKEHRSPRNIDKLGIFKYRSPETPSSFRDWEKSDVYSWAVILWECITRNEPFVEEYDQKSCDLKIKHLTHLSDIPNASAMFNQFIRKCVHLNPENRSSILFLNEILKNLDFSTKKEAKIDLYGTKTICIWDEEKFVYCKLFICDEFSLEITNFNVAEQNGTWIIDQSSLKATQIRTTTAHCERLYLADYNNQKIAVVYFHVKSMFLKCFETMSKLKHENLVKILGKTEFQHSPLRDGKFFYKYGFVMEYTHGNTLQNVIEDKSISYKLSDIIRWGVQSTSALDYLHSLSSNQNEHSTKHIHRNICPQNMILDPRLEILKICGFEEAKEIVSSASTTTGRRSYIAPKVLGQSYDEKCDVYSWGCVFWQCITRQLPDSSYSFSNGGFGVRDIHNASSMFNQLLLKCTNYDSKKRWSISMIKTVLENMISSDDVKNYDIFQENTICFWDDEEFYHYHKIAPNDFIKGKKNSLLNFDYHAFKNPQEVGHGNFGKVLCAEYDDKKVAVKYLCTMNMIPYLKEFNALNNLKHENIVKVIGHTEDSGIFGIVMEFIDGRNLDEIIYESPRRYSLHDTLKWNYQLASALNYMHATRCIHRDIKPANLLIESETQRLKICDLGGAKQTETFLENTVMGTPSYMAPEVSENKRYNELSDVYSFTITFWECYTGEKPQMNPSYRSNSSGKFSKKFVEIIENCSSSNPLNRKSMFVIEKWLEDMLRNGTTIEETDVSFRERNICVWDEETRDLYYSNLSVYSDEDSENRFKNDLTKAKTSYKKYSFDTLKIVEDKDVFVKLIEVDGERKVLKFPKNFLEKYFENEFLIMSKLKHENIVQILGYTDNVEQIFGFSAVIMEYMKGRTLDEVIHDTWPKYGIEEKLKWSLQSVSALEYMHSQQILHCDIKPANMLIRDDDKCLKICDFNCARDLHYTQNNERVGTPRYMAPEVWRNGLTTAKSDVYSWTVTLWECITRQYPFAENEAERFNDESIDVKLAKIEIASEKFNDFIQTCMDIDPDKRWTFANIKTLLENILKNGNRAEAFSQLEVTIAGKEKSRIWENCFCLKTPDNRIEQEFYYTSDSIPVVFNFKSL